MKLFKLAAIGVVLLAIGGGLWGYWWYGTVYPSTQDAYVRANIVTIAAEVTGRVVAVDVVENQRVSAGDPLFELDSEIYTNAVTQARAQARSAAQATASFERQIEAASAAVDSATSRGLLAKKRRNPTRSAGAKSSLSYAETCPRIGE